MELCTWPLPSAPCSTDIGSLQTLVYVRLSGAVAVNRVTSVGRLPQLFGADSLPQLRHSTRSSVGFAAIVQHLRDIGYDCDTGVDASQKADITAWSHYVSNKLLPAVTHMRWANEAVYRNGTRKCWLSVLPFPSGHLLLYKWRKQARHYLESLSDTKLADDVLQQHLYSEAEKCLEAVAKRLEEGSVFLAGSSPRSVDAVLYGLLAPLADPACSGDRLCSVFRSHQSLVDYVDRITVKYLAKDFSERPKDCSGAEQKGDESSFPHTLRNTLLFSLLSVGALVGYALVTGMAQISIGSDTELEEQEEEYFEESSDE